VWCRRKEVRGSLLIEERGVLNVHLIIPIIPILVKECMCIYICMYVHTIRLRDECVCASCVRDEYVFVFCLRERARNGRCRLVGLRDECVFTFGLRDERGYTTWLRNECVRVCFKASVCMHHVYTPVHGTRVHHYRKQCMCQHLSTYTCT